MTKIALIFFIVAFPAFSQEKNLQLTKDSDTTYWLKYRADLYEVANNNESFFRLQTPCTSIEVSKTMGNVKGTIDYFVREVDEFKDSTVTFKRRFNFDSDVVLKIFKLIDSLKINSIPSDKFIQNWQQGFDGITYIFEYKDPDIHSFKTYWTPKAQIDLHEALTIENFVSNVYLLVQSEKLRKIFDNDIPFNSWTCNGTIVSRIMTVKQYQDYKKKKRKLKNKNGG